ncbi:MAG: 16S rRNA (guanine(527)-N(7))-methyltransferase RsmG [Clostridia bacterium]|nr:16S rRNA (guanine(527)-N(7))-methyltransferase RsmG [Clostridia bacterium]
MDFNQFNKFLYECFEENSLSELLDEEKSKKLYGFAKLLIETNKKMNLTAITDMDGVIFKHFGDSAKICSHISVDAKVIDVGCGAGFPSFPLAILRPDLEITALDSTAKKTAFIQNCAKELGVVNITSVAARAEEFAEAHRESFDYATSRAVARLNILCELCIPLVEVGGSFVPLKASKAQEELDEARCAIRALGGTLKSVNEYKLVHSGEELERYILEIKKASQTDKKYPRKYAQILKKPL